MFKTVLQKSQDGYWAVWLLNQSRRQLTRQGRQRRHLRPSCTGHSQWKCPVEKRWFLKTTFDSGSSTNAVSEKVAIQLKKLGVPWGEAGGGVSMAVSSSVAVPHGELRLLLSAEPSGSDGRADELAIPRPLQFVTDALIMKDLSNDLIIGWPTLKGTGLLAVVLGLEEYELEEDKDDDGLGELWEASEDPQYGPPTVKEHRRNYEAPEVYSQRPNFRQLLSVKRETRDRLDRPVTGASRYADF